MNIKTVTANPILPIDPLKRVDGNVRTKGSTDRDAQGRREQAEPELKRHLNQQEFDEAMKALEDIPGLKSNQLTLQVEQKDDCRTILILGPDGQVIRRLSENQLWLISRDKDKQTGKILDKAM